LDLWDEGQHLDYYESSSIAFFTFRTSSNFGMGGAGLETETQGNPTNLEGGGEILLQ
jgi:hypothetical protein